MTILDRYVTKEYVKLFFLIMVSFTALFLIIDLFERMRMFLSNHATLSQIVSYLIFMMPLIISQAIPVAVLLASLITFSHLSKYSEILAMKANGISLYRTSLPVIIIVFIICILSFLFNEYITPYTNEKADYIKLIEIEKQKPLGSFKQNQTWYRGTNGIYNFKMFDPVTNSLNGITINYLDKHFVLNMRIDAETARWENNQWVFYNLMITRFQPGQFPFVEWVSTKVIDLPEKPIDFTSVQKEASKMSYMELRRYIKKIQAEGYDATRYLVDMHGKVAFTLVSMILVIIGISFSLMKTERSGGIMQCIGVGIVIGFSYWVVHALFMSLGRSGTIPPVLSAWIANLILGSISIVMYLRVKT
ncbi:MAG: LPS export ABC transporter permease LptG [Deltaproteobacteria bacterium]